VTSILGRDFKTTFASQFAGRLYPASFTKFTSGVVDPNDAAAAGSPTSADYVCDGIALAYHERDVDGSIVKKGDYKVVIMLGSIASVVDDAVAASLALGGILPHADTVIVAKVAGAAGDRITVELVGDGPAECTIVEVGTNVRIGFMPAVTTVMQLENAIDHSTLVEVGTSGTLVSFLEIGDELAATPLAGGVDNSVEPANVVPNPTDLIRIPPPGQDVAKQGRILEILAITQAAVTVAVRGIGE
jgi:hypothetical protein